MSQPPSGIMPKKLWLEERLLELNKAIQRRITTPHQIPQEWIEERNWLLEQLDDK